MTLDPEPAAPSLTARQPRAIHTALAVLEEVAAKGVGVTAREISAALGLPRATTYRLLNLLVEDEYLVRTPDLNGFALGAKVVQLAAVASPARLHTAARAVVSDARSALRGGVHVVLFDAGRLTVADMDPDFPLSDAVLLAREPTRFALGRLALLDSAPFTSDGRRASEDLQRYGAVRQIGEVAAGRGCVAVPIRAPDGHLAAGIGFSGSRHRVEHPEDVVDILRSAAEDLTPLLT